MKAKPSSIFSCFFKSLSCSWLAVAAHTLDKRALSLFCSCQYKDVLYEEASGIVFFLDAKHLCSFYLYDGSLGLLAYISGKRENSTSALLG
jgi:hypothetical protein